jgi:plastocyanin
MKTSTLTTLLLGAAITAAAGFAFANSSSTSASSTSAELASPLGIDSHNEAARPAADGGTVQVKVVWEGEKPEALGALVISPEASKGCCAEGVAMDTTNQLRLIDASGGVANVVLTIGVKDMPVKVPEGRKYVLDQKQCRFEPHMQVVPIGATIEYHNSDTVAHNVHVYATKNGDLNNSVAAGSKAEQKLDKSELVTIKCDIHPWMAAYVYVTDDPIYGVTKADGSATLEGVPAGKYKVAYNHPHETVGKGKSEEITVEAGKTTTVEIKVGGAKKKKAR